MLIKTLFINRKSGKYPVKKILFQVSLEGLGTGTVRLMVVVVSYLMLTTLMPLALLNAPILMNLHILQRKQQLPQLQQQRQLPLLQKNQQLPQPQPPPQLQPLLRQLLLKLQNFYAVLD